jgi:alkanesulfonate monooxygenase SsuD/methylene tetrahydromethanopterin reductase-like flavin-dependent oxidoreductase (luciferase family)
VADYGHDLLFGSFIGPHAAQADAVVALAEVSERSGLDLVTFQDHPYQPGFLDTWTLLSFVAARTQRIRLSANVLNLPLRPPAVLAQAAASLDILSGGRFELGLGAGAFWDAIEAMGGRRLTPGQAVDALEEAIGIIRASWAADERGGIFRKGDYYSVDGAKRGPAPAHDVSIWLGALKPRMLELVGRAADGWLPSLPYLGSLDALHDGNKRIDSAAVEAGRDPGAIRRMLNIGGAEAQPETLASLALEYGVSAFILMSDDAREIARFGQEIAPAVRALVEAERTRSPRAESPASVLIDDHAKVDAALGVTPTVDDGTRVSSRRMWNEDERPVAPAPPAGTTYSDQGRAVSQHLVDVHDHLRAELEQLRQLVTQVLDGQVDVGFARSAINEMTMRQNDWVLGAYCAAYCRTVTTHHTIEDASMFPYLKQRDRGLAPVIDRLQAEHVDIHEVLEDLDRALVQFVSEPRSGAVLREAVDLLTDTLLSHLAYEERELAVPLARYGMGPGQV